MAVGIACLGFGLSVLACDGAGPRSGNGKEAAMTGSIPQAAIPLIDAAAPAKTETASFALG